VLPLNGFQPSHAQLVLPVEQCAERQQDHGQCAEENGVRFTYNRLNGGDVGYVRALTLGKWVAG
jgi:hypothetical protein